jgi:transcription elongation factor S-II
MDNKYRNIAIKKINEIVKDDNKSNLIENSVYNYTTNISVKRGYPINMENSMFRNTYKNKLMSLYINLKPDSYVKNNNLLKNINANKIDLLKIAFMKPIELFPEKWEDVLKRKIAKKELQYSKFVGNVTDKLICSMCKKNHCSYNKIQMRSIDEPMTTKVRCLNCNHRWQFC